jgi:hypothetical protein
MVMVGRRFSPAKPWTRSWLRRSSRGLAVVVWGAHAALGCPSRADATGLAAPPYEVWRGERVAPPGRVGPPEPPPLERPVELARKPSEVAGEVGVSLPLCADDAPEPCSALGAAFEGAIVALYRPSPYFAAGGVLSSSFAGGRLEGEVVEARTLMLGARLRVYLIEQGELDPYLELGFGFAEVRRSAGRRGVETSVGPFGEVGGGADVLLGRNLRLGAGVFASDVFVAGAGAERRVGAVFRLAFGFGEPL